MNDFIDQIKERLKLIRPRNSRIWVVKGDIPNLFNFKLEQVEFNIYLDDRDNTAMCFLRVDSEEDNEIPAYVAYRSLKDDLQKNDTTYEDVSSTSIADQMASIEEAINCENGLAITKMIYFCRGYEMGYNDIMTR